MIPCIFFFDSIILFISSPACLKLSLSTSTNINILKFTILTSCIQLFHFRYIHLSSILVTKRKTVSAYNVIIAQYGSEIKKKFMKMASPKIFVYLHNNQPSHLASFHIEHCFLYNDLLFSKFILSSNYDKII